MPTSSYNLPIFEVKKHQNIDFQYSPNKSRSITLTQQKNHRNMPTRALNLTEEMANNLPKIHNSYGIAFGNIGNLQSHYTKKIHTVKIPKVSYHNFNADEVLFDIYINKKKPNKKTSDNSMHKTFFDIYPELNQRSESKQNKIRS